MKNNKLGFTLMELIAVIVIIGIIAIIAIPNVINMVDKGKKEQYVSDAKEMISKAKYRFKLEKYKALFTSDGTCSIISAKNLDYTKIETSDGGEYDLVNSKVRVCLETNQYVYYVISKSIVTEGSGRGVNNSGSYVKEADLSIDFVN